MGLLKLCNNGSTSVTQGITATANGEVPVSLGRLGAQVGSDIGIFWGTNAAALTVGKLTDTNGVQYIDVAAPADSSVQEYAVEIYNPSTQTDLTVKILSKEADVDGTNDRESLITTLSIPKAAVINTGGDGDDVTVAMHTKLVHGMFMGADARMYFLNDTGTTLTTFTAYMRIREVSN